MLKYKTKIRGQDKVCNCVFQIFILSIFFFFLIRFAGGLSFCWSFQRRSLSFIGYSFFHFLAFNFSFYLYQIPWLLWNYSVEPVDNFLGRVLCHAHCCLHIKSSSPRGCRMTTAALWGDLLPCSYPPGEGENIWCFFLASQFIYLFL